MRSRMTTNDRRRIGLSRGARLLTAALVAGSLYGLAGAGPAAAQSYKDLNEAVTKLASRLASTDRLHGKRVLVNAHDFFEEGTGRNLPLSATLRERFTTELSSRGLAVFSLPEGSEDDMVIFQGVWRVLSESGVAPARLHLTVKVTERTQGGHRTQSADGRVEGVDVRLLTPDLDSWGRHVVKELENRVRDRRHRDIHVGAFDLTGKVNEPEIVREDLEAFWLEPAFAESRLFRLVAASAGGGSDGSLHVRASFGREVVNFRLKVVDGQGGQVTAAKVTMARKVLGDILGEEAPPSSTVALEGLRVFIVARREVSGKAALMDWLATRPRLVVGPMVTEIQTKNITRYLGSLGAPRVSFFSQMLSDPSEIYPAFEKGIFDGVVTADDRLLKELRPLYSGPPLELRSRSDFNESDDVVLVIDR